MAVDSLSFASSPANNLLMVHCPIMHRLLGIETEYGISVEGSSANDLIAESIALVRSYAGAQVADKWNYRGEDPRRDLRGFTVDHLSTDPDDAQFDAPDRPRMSVSEERSDRVLSNGARLYNDHGHPEYSTPECSNLKDLVAHDRAGERVVWECAKARMQSAGGSGQDHSPEFSGPPLVRGPEITTHHSPRISIYKNNTDYHGASYGTHECYLMRRDVPPDALIQGLIPFFVTRQLFAGAGKVGAGTHYDPGFQLSQRADFFAVDASVDTLHNRHIVNTRDEPHATPSKYRRLHVIVGDANMSEWATAMKAGTTSLVVSLLEQGWQSPVALKRPVDAIKQISRDQTLQWCVELDGAPSVYAIDIQRLYLNEAKKRLAGLSPDDDWTLVEWEAVLNDLADDIMRCADRVDWVAKRKLLEQFMAEEGASWNDPIMQSLDLAYHDVDPEVGLYYGLQAEGLMRRLVTEARIDAAMSCPPEDTRAFIRGMFVRNFGPSVRSIGWNGIAFNHHGEDLLFDMNPLVEENVGVLNDEMAGAASLAEVVNMIKRAPDD
jgi:proteasome accessory factor PafA2